MMWRLRLLSRHIAPRGASLLSEAVIYVLQGKCMHIKCVYAVPAVHFISPHCTGAMIADRSWSEAVTYMDVCV